VVLASSGILRSYCSYKAFPNILKVSLALYTCQIFLAISSVRVRYTSGQKVALKAESEEMIEVTKERKGRKTLFDKQD
jgi:hypothetical protein